MKQFLRLFPFLTILTYLYGKIQGRKSENSKRDAMLIEDMVDAKKVSNGVDILSDDGVDSRLRVYAKKRRKTKK